MLSEDSENMRICAIIAEFNPFHNGHKYIVEQAKKMGFTHIVVIMSGNFVQRGEPAIFSKKTRTQSALMNGVDLVVEMPCVWVLSSAEKYAEAGVYLADALGCVDSLVFGSECGELKMLSDIANSLTKPEFANILRDNLKSGVTFAKAREKTIAELLPNISASKILSSGNDILGVEYIKAIQKLRSTVKPLTLQRSGDFKSASEIRELIKKNDKSYYQYIPNGQNELEPPKDIFWGEKGILAVLKTADLDYFSKMPDISEGLENKIYNSLCRCTDLADLLTLIKSKRYTMSRIKRIIMCAYLGITSKMQSERPPYLRILGATKKGFEVLNVMNRTAKLPIVSKFSGLADKNDFSREVFEMECKATDLFGVFGEKLSLYPSEKKFKFIRQE